MREQTWVEQHAYPWHDEHGEVLLYHQRVSIQENGVEVRKAMPWWVVDANPDGHVRDFDSGALVPVRANDGVQPPVGLVYRLPELLSALRSGVDEVWLPEGERDAETCRAAGLAATTGWGGGGKWWALWRILHNAH